MTIPTLHQTKYVFTLDRQPEIETQNWIDRDLFSLKAAQKYNGRSDRSPPT